MSWCLEEENDEESHTIILKDFEYKVIPEFINAIRMVPKAQPQSAEKQKKCLYCKRI